MAINPFGGLLGNLMARSPIAQLLQQSQAQPQPRLQPQATMDLSPVLPPPSAPTAEQQNIAPHLVAPGEQSAAYREAIAGIESGGRYDAKGPVTKSGDRAFGKYQVMGNNIGPWTQATLGRAMSPEEFLANPKAQDAVFDRVFGGYVQRFGPEGAAQAWFGGPGAVGKTNRRDVLGTDVGKYGRMFMSSLGKSRPSGGSSPTSEPATAGVGQMAAGGERVGPDWSVYTRTLQARLGFTDAPFTPSSMEQAQAQRLAAGGQQQGSGRGSGGGASRMQGAEMGPAQVRDDAEAFLSGPMQEIAQRRTLIAQKQAQRKAEINKRARGQA